MMFSQRATSNLPPPKNPGAVRSPLCCNYWGGFWGLECRLGTPGGPRFGSLIIDRRNHHLFQPLLYQVATAGLSPANIAYPIRSLFRRHRNIFVLLDEAVSIDLPGRKVTTTQGDVSYDFLILAAGASTSYFGHDEWSQHAPGLKSLEDALEIRQRILLAFELAEHEREERGEAARLAELFRSCSASSKASRIRRRISSASSRLLSPGACCDHSS